MQNWIDLMGHIMTYGDLKENRTGIDTKAVFGTMLEHDITRNFPAVTVKKLQFNSVAAELAGFLLGVTSAADMRALGTKIWDANAHDWSSSDYMGRVYGSQWRDWTAPEQSIDQLREVVDGIKKDPFSRRHLITAWNPAELQDMCLPPCHTHYQFQVTTNGYLNCAYYMRSVDTFLGMPFDIASFALLTYIVANECDLKPGRLISFFADTHLYVNHFPQVEIAMSREPLAPPRLELHKDATIDNFMPDMAKLVNYNTHGVIKAEMAV